MKEALSAARNRKPALTRVVVILCLRLSVKPFAFPEWQPRLPLQTIPRRVHGPCPFSQISDLYKKSNLCHNTSSIS
jgi:hypothetical protein